MCDVGDEASVKHFFDEVQRTVGKIHHIVHSAGISPNTEFFDQTEGEWAKVLQTNLTGSFLIAKYGAAIMDDDATKNRSFVFVSSTNGINSNAYYSAHYDSSKAGVNILTKNVAELLRDRRIRANAVAPGWIDTTLNDTLPPGEREVETAKIFAGRFAHPNEIAAPIAFLASPDASYVNGSVIMVDGGYRG